MFISPREIILVHQLGLEKCWNDFLHKSSPMARSLEDSADLVIRKKESSNSICSSRTFNRRIPRLHSIPFRTTQTCQAELLRLRYFLDTRAPLVVTFPLLLHWYFHDLPQMTIAQNYSPMTSPVTIRHSRRVAFCIFLMASSTSLTRLAESWHDPMGPMEQQNPNGLPMG